MQDMPILLQVSGQSQSARREGDVRCTIHEIWEINCILSLCGVVVCHESAIVEFPAKSVGDNDYDAFWFDSITWY
jgi:hypothetical protein